MKKKNLTLSEIVIVIVVIGIFVTIGIPLYNNTVENAKAKACELNLKTILGAVEAQTLERNSFPASLSAISDKNFQKGWAKVLKEEGAFKVKLVYFLVNFDEKGLAYAQNAEPWIHRFITESNVLQCPSVHEGISYGLNSSLAGKTFEEYNTEPGEVIVVGDCNTNVFAGDGQLAGRHKEYKIVGSTNYAVTLTKSHKKKKVHTSGEGEHH
ncbi:MAG: hypothetical protein WC330_03535 [Candidatus Omnitrophota bacterium]|jgi:competence protein ComGC